MVNNSYEDFIKILLADITVEIFTDGACSGNPGPGGWGAIIRQGSSEIELSGGHLNTTNNRMEMMAAIESLDILPSQTKINIHTDSQYLKDGITLWMTNWKKKGWLTANKTPVKNKDLWVKLDEICSRLTVEWHWIRGHDGHPENERVDALARRAIIAQRMKA